MKWLRENGLLVANLLLFIAFVAGLAISGWDVANQELIEHGRQTESFGSYLVSPDFGEAVFENWESEFLQMGAFVVLTVFLFQKGSAESKPIEKPAPQDEDPRKRSSDPKAPWPVRHGGMALRLYENSLLILFAVLFIAAFALHLGTGAAKFSEEQVRHGGAPVTALEYLGTSQFWFESMQNWQSEFLAIAVLVGASVFLRQRGSPESKPVATPHEETGG